jgi:hypothetical protein
VKSAEATIGKSIRYTQLASLNASILNHLFDPSNWDRSRPGDYDKATQAACAQADKAVLDCQPERTAPETGGDSEQKSIART